MIRYFLKNKLLLILTVFLIIFLWLSLAAFSFVFTFVTKTVKDMDFLKGQFAIVYSVAVLFLIFIFYISCNYFTRKMINQMLKCLRFDLFKNLINRPVKVFLKESEGNYMSLLLNDLDILDKKYFDPMQNILANIIQFICFSVIFLKTGSLSIYLIVILLITPLIIIPNFYQKKLKVLMGKLQTENIKYTNAVKSYIFNSEYINLYNKSNKVTELFKENIESIERIKYDFNKDYGILIVLIGALTTFVSVTMSIILNYYAIIGIILFANVMTLVNLSSQMSLPVMTFWQMLSSAKSTKPIRDKIMKILSEYSEQNENKEKIVHFKNSILINNLSFSYDSINILNNVSFEFKKYKKYLLIGGSGSGKSTLLKLVLGYYDDYSGSIKIDNHEINNLHQKSLSNLISYVHQNVFLFKGTILENITAFKDSYTLEELNHAVELSKLNEVILEKEHGLNTILDENCSILSGGEKQRISIARAIFKNSEILIMDEGTSALDNITTNFIEKSILSLKNTTVISITHKLKEDIVKLYDEILVFENGTIVERGNFNELMKTKNAFYNLFMGMEKIYEES